MRCACALEPRRYVVGFGKFEQWVYRSAAEREGDAGARSQAGDLDLTVYSLRKWARLALQGNPTVLLLLFLPDSALVVRTQGGEQLQEIAPAFASRRAGRRFLGYLEAQRQRLVGDRGQRNIHRRQNWSRNLATTPNTRCICSVLAIRASSFWNRGA
jgi:hypothetical protein